MRAVLLLTVQLTEAIEAARAPADGAVCRMRLSMMGERELAMRNAMHALDDYPTCGLAHVFAQPAFLTDLHRDAPTSNFSAGVPATARAVRSRRLTRARAEPCSPVTSAVLGGLSRRVGSVLRQHSAPRARVQHDATVLGAVRQPHHETVGAEEARCPCREPPRAPARSPRRSRTIKCRGSQSESTTQRALTACSSRRISQARDGSTFSSPQTAALRCVTACRRCSIEMQAGRFALAIRQGAQPERQDAKAPVAPRQAAWRPADAAAVSAQVCTHSDVILTNATIKTLIGSKCDGVIGQVRALKHVPAVSKRSRPQRPLATVLHISALAPHLAWCMTARAGKQCREGALGPNRPDGEAAVSRLPPLTRARLPAPAPQLTEDWGNELFSALKAAKGRAFSNYAVGYNNVDVKAGQSAPRSLRAPPASQTPIWPLADAQLIAGGVGERHPSREHPGRAD